MIDCHYFYSSANLPHWYLEIIPDPSDDDETETVTLESELKNVVAEEAPSLPTPPLFGVDSAR